MLFKTRDEYIEFYLQHYGRRPPDKLLEKYYPPPVPDPHDATEKDREQFWESPGPEILKLPGS